MKKIAVGCHGNVCRRRIVRRTAGLEQGTERKIKVFYPGQASLEWVMNKADHSAVPDIVDKKRACAKCHEGDANEIGDNIVAGKPVGSSKVSAGTETARRQGRLLPVTFQAAHDGNNIYFRFEWVPPKTGDDQDGQEERGQAGHDVRWRRHGRRS